MERSFGCGCPGGRCPRRLCDNLIQSGQRLGQEVTPTAHSNSSPPTDPFGDLPPTTPLSTVGVLRLSWSQLWQRPTIFNLVFWNLLISLVVVSVYTARLAHYLPPALTNTSKLLSGAPVSLALAPGAVLRLGLFLATVLLIVTPYRVAGLYGGVAELLMGKGQRSWLYFFGVGRRLFWHGLAITLAGAALVLVLVLLGIAAGFLGGVPGVGELVLLIWLAVVVWSVTLAFRGLGAMAAAESHAGAAIVASLRWAAARPGFCLGFGLAFGVMMLLAFFVVASLASVPLLGPLFAFAGLWVMTGMLAVVPTVLYRLSLA